jgi:CBS domain-containing protein
VISTNQSIELPTLEQAIDYAPLIVEPTAAIIDAITLMNQGGDHHLGCVIIVENSRVMGILTDRDVVRLTTTGIDFSQVPILEVMTQPVITLNQTQSQDIFAMLSCLQRHQISYLPIVNEQEQLIGIVTAHNLLQPSMLCGKSMN